MMPPEALHGWAPWFGQWCSFAISSLRRTRATYGFRAGLDSVELVAVRLELVDRFSGELGGRQHGDVVLLPGLEDRQHPRLPIPVPEDVVVEDERANLRRPQDSGKMAEGPFRVFPRIMFRHVCHRTVDVEDRWLGVDEERQVFLQGRAEHVGRVDEDFVPLGDPRHHDVPELVVVAVRHRPGEEQLRPAEVHLVAGGHLDRLRIRLELADERARTLPLTPIDVELAVLQESELAAEDRRSRGVVVVVVVVAHREDIRSLRSIPDDLPQFFLARALGRMRGEVVAVRAKSDAWVQQDGDVRCLDERRHGTRAEAVRREGRNLHWITAWPHIYGETTDRISPAIPCAAATGLAAS